MKKKDGLKLNGMPSKKKINKEKGGEYKMDVSQEILSSITIFMKYARYLPKEYRRENWGELVDRNKNMHLKKFPQLKNEIENAYKFVYDKKVLPSMRSMQFAGKPAEINNTRIFNCSYLPVDNWVAFSEIMFLLLGGTGVGFSVQKHHIEELPEITKPNPKQIKRYLVGDSIEGWADAVRALMKSYFRGGQKVEFDFSDIRAKGALLVTSGGKAPGPGPLRECLLKIENILETKQNGDKLSSLEIHDIVCFIADAVLAGGIRRAALISLFSADDEAMLSCKTGEWYELNPQRGRANNSAVLVRHKITKKFFLDLWKKIEFSNAGEPGFLFTNDKDLGTNPCVEISLKPNQFCNLCEINVSNIESQEDLEERARAAAFIGTLQASYTNFHYLRPVWKRTTEKEALLGIGATGIASDVFLSLDVESAATVVIEENERVAKIIGINKAARTTCVKPSGTTSCVLGTSSGIHAWYDLFYLRRMRVGKNESIYGYLKENHPELLEDDFFRPTEMACICLPQRAPEGSITREENVISFLERVKNVSLRWVIPGHRTGSNTHNVSATISIKKDEWDVVGEWMWENREFYNGLSCLPYDTGTYKQTPFEEITEEHYNKLIHSLKAINLDNVFEKHDDTNLTGEIACAGKDSCEVK